MIYPTQLNVFGSGLSPQVSYKYDRASSSWKKHFNIYDHLGTLAQTYKKVGIFGITPTSMQTHNPFGSERWANSNLTETESTLLNWVGKEKDNESKLGDHGMRKYEYETGRFISIDPLWGKYYGWTPYQYSMNSPVMMVDIDGKDIYVLLDIEGANQLGVAMGHQAILIGTEYDEENESGGYYLYSKNGGLLGVSGPSEDPEVGEFYKSINDFLNDEKQDRYDKAIRIDTDEDKHDKDPQVIENIKNQVIEGYTLFKSSCNHTATCALESINKQEKEILFQPGRSDIPNISFQQLYNWNRHNKKVSSPIDLNEWRKYLK